MRWQPIYSPEALEFLEKTDKKISERIILKVESSRENPHHFFERLVGFPYYKLRVGKYRVIADLQNEIKIIAVLRIGHRKKVYREIEK